MIRPSLFLSLTLVLTALFAAELPLPADPALQHGTLGNGLRWAVLSNDEPAGQLSIRVHVDAGSVQEREVEQGVAHYLEHLAFQGSAHFPEGDLIDRLQQVGIAHGSQSNAHTGFEETVYKIDLPDLEEATIRLAFQAASDMVGRLLLPVERIDNERGVIRAEMRDRDTPSSRISRQVYAAMMEGLLLPRRFPIGQLETIEALDRELIAGFYQRWYRPDRLIVAVVGDLPDERLAALVTEHFADLPPVTGEPEHPDYGSLAAYGQRFVVATDPEAGDIGLNWTAIEADPEPADSAAWRELDLRRDLGAAVLTQRLTEIAQGGDAPIEGGSAGYGYWFDHRLASVSVRVKASREAGALQVVEQERRRLLEHGPTAGELAVAIAGYRARLEAAVARAANRTHVQLATGIYGALRDQRSFATPAQWLAFYEPLLARADPAAVHEAFGACWTAVNTCLVLTGTGPYPEDQEQILASLWRQSREQPVAARKEDAAVSWAYGTAPDADLEGRRVEDLTHGITSIAYPNGVRLHLLPRADKPNEVILRATLHLPRLPLPPLGAPQLFAAASQTSALGEHEAMDLLRLFAHVQSSLHPPSVDPDAIRFTVSGPPGEVDLAMQWLRAWLIDAGWRAPVYAMQRDAWVRRLEAAQSDVDHQVGRHWDLLSSGGDPRREPSPAEAAVLEMQAVRDWVGPLLESAALEVSVVGDFLLDAVAASGDQWLAALPRRTPLRVTPDLSAPGALWPGAQPLLGRHVVDLVGQVDRTVIRVGWPAGDAADIAQRRRLQLLGMILREEVRKGVREQIGEAYSPWASYSGSLVVDDRGMLLIHAAVEPAQAERVEAVIRGIVATLATDGVDQAKLDFVRLPLLKQLDTMLQQNRYWLQVVDGCVSRPQQLAWAASITTGYAEVTAAELQALATAIFAGRDLTLVVTSRIAPAATSP